MSAPEELHMGKKYPAAHGIPASMAVSILKWSEFGELGCSLKINKLNLPLICLGRWSLDANLYTYNCK